MKIFLLALALLTSACASSTIQTDQLFRERPALPERSVISDVPFIEQSAGHCGPATLTMLLQKLGKKTDVNEIAPQVYTPGMKGSFQADMISAGRRQGFLAIPITGMNSLLTEIHAGNPVIVFENLAFSWLPQWHYALVYGYDLSKPEVYLHSGPEKDKIWDMRKLERSWKLADYWGLILIPPGQLSASANELAHVTAAAALEDLKMVKEAERSYQAILKKWPQSLGALIGLGNIEARKRNYEASLVYFQQAKDLHPQSEAAQKNYLTMRTYLNK